MIHGEKVEFNVKENDCLGETEKFLDIQAFHLKARPKLRVQ